MRLVKASPEQKALIALMTAAGRLRRELGSVLDERGVSASQYNVLRILRGAGGALPTMAIRDRMMDREPSITRLVDRLEERGLVERYRSTRDRRIVHSRLTRQGRSALRKAPGLLHERFLTRFSELSERRQREIVKALQKVADMMGASDLDAAPLLEVGSVTKGTNARS